MNVSHAASARHNRALLNANIIAEDKTGEHGVCSAELLIQTFNDLRDDLLSTLCYILRNRHDALDAAQDTFLKCWRVRHTLTGIRNLRSWIFRVAINVARDRQSSVWQRRSKQLGLDDPLLSNSIPGPHAALEQREELERLSAALHRLRQDEKEVFFLRQNSDLTYEEIAGICRRPIGTIKTQMRSALQKLRRQLAPATYEAGPV